jgi:hypothetical protein
MSPTLTFLIVKNNETQLLLSKLKHNYKLNLYSIRSIPFSLKENNFVLGEKGLSDNNHSNYTPR